MTLLVVLGIVVVITILAALFLSLKSGRNHDGASVAGAAGDRQARGGSRSRPSSLGGRVRSMTGRDKAVDHPGRRAAGRADDGFGDDYGPPGRPPRGTGGPERSGLVASGAGRGQDRGRPGPGFDDTGPGPHSGYRRDLGGYDGYDSGASARVSGPVSPEAGTEVFGAGRYDSPGPPRARHGHARGGTPSGFRERARDDFGPPGQDAGWEGRGERGRRPAPAAHDFDTDPGATMAGLGGPEGDTGSWDSDLDRDGGAGGGRGGRRRARESGAPGNFDDATTAREADQAGPREGGRRRAGRIQKPRLRRDKNDFDDSPWPGYDEEAGAIPDEKYWEGIYSDRPLSTTARTAHPASDAGPGWGELPAQPGPVPAEQDDLPPGRGRRARRRQEDPLGATGPLDPGTEPRPVAPPDFGPGPRGRGRASRSAEEDPLTSESFSRHAREATDSRSYRGPRDPNRPPAYGPDSASADTQAIRRDGHGYGPDPLSGPGPRSGPSPMPPAPRGGRGAPGGGLPGGGPGGPGRPGGPGAPAGPGGGLPSAPRQDPYSGNGYRGPGPGNGYRNGTGPGPDNGYRNGTGPGPDNGYRNGTGPGPDNGYRNGTGPGPAYPDRSGGYPPPDRSAPRPPAPGPGTNPAGPGYSPGNGSAPGGGYSPAGYPPATGRPPAPPAPGGVAGPPPGGWSPAPADPGPAAPGGSGRRPGYNPNGGAPYPGQPSGDPGYPADPSYPGGYYPPGPGAPGGPGDPGGPAERPRGRRAAGRDDRGERGGSRRWPEDGYDGPFPPEDRRR
ncbi:MAG TPA: hypothetical protein VGD68_04005 [Streptosporangiaceae bacterium]